MVLGVVVILAVGCDGPELVVRLVAHRRLPLPFVDLDPTGIDDLSAIGRGDALDGQTQRGFPTLRGSHAATEVRGDLLPSMQDVRAFAWESSGQYRGSAERQRQFDRFKRSLAVLCYSPGPRS